MIRRIAAAGVLASLIAGCGAPTPGLSNGSVSACYRAIPTGRQAVHDPHATLIGVHRIPADKVRERLPLKEQHQLAADNDTTVCVVAFKGEFRPGQVDLAPSGESGTYAVVLISSKKLRLIDAAVLDHLPGALGKRTL
ncbi:MAG TPA: hypothetical protein VMU75_03720 [Acidimicrobiales bacterium]|nr:hypothetical protein [Acidimicrobiales bacterium]